MGIYNELKSGEKKIALIGLGYVGLPIALEFAKHFDVIGFDINESRVQMMKDGKDPSKELDDSAFENKRITFTTDLEVLKEANFYIVAVPTDINENKVPHLGPLLGASKTVGSVVKKGDYVVFESTVYPGCTEEDCVPVMEKESGLKSGVDFSLGYSPERIVPGDKVRTLTKITKIVSGDSEESLKEIADVYRHIIEAGVHEASSIKVAEAAKVIENTQRDLNISLMNELSIIFDKMDIDTQEVLKAAGTKWNFLKFHPGLVGGHCIGVDPYYLMHKAKGLGIDPQVIAAGRRINDGMPTFIATKLVQMLIEAGKNPGDTKVLVKGITFKEDVADIRNSKVVDLIHGLMDFSVVVHVEDEHASANEVAHEYKLTLADNNVSDDYDAVIVAVAHDDYMNRDADYFLSLMNDKNPILVDIKSIYDRKEMSKKLQYWNL
ncbi:nucleotide sugar dehydrogenase [Saprospiraceae bacterium]|nr:nucleotide sugar dehydrogenase [Saprospiraceae bacterium]